MTNLPTVEEICQKYKANPWPTLEEGTRPSVLIRQAVRACHELKQYGFIPVWGFAGANYEEKEICPGAMLELLRGRPGSTDWRVSDLTVDLVTPFSEEARLELIIILGNKVRDLPFDGEFSIPSCKNSDDYLAALEEYATRLEAHGL